MKLLLDHCSYEGVALALGYRGTLEFLEVKADFTPLLHILKFELISIQARLHYKNNFVMFVISYSFFIAHRF